MSREPSARDARVGRPQARPRRRVRQSAATPGGGPTPQGSTPRASKPQSADARAAKPQAAKAQGPKAQAPKRRARIDALDLPDDPVQKRAPAPPGPARRAEAERRAAARRAAAAKDAPAEERRGDEPRRTQTRRAPIDRRSPARLAGDRRLADVADSAAQTVREIGGEDVAAGTSQSRALDVVREDMFSPETSSGVRPRVHIAIAAATFVLGALFFAPASLIAPALTARPDVGFAGVEGRLWSGRIKSLSVAGRPIGDVSYRLSALALLTGRLEARVEARGPDATVSGLARYAPLTGRVAVRDADVEFNLASIKDYTLFGLPYDGSARARIARLDWDGKGCRRAEGDVWTNALDRSAKRFGTDGIELAGPLSCGAGGNLILSLSGANAEGAALIEIAVTPSLEYSLVANVRPERDDVRQSLKLLGFQSDGSALVYDAFGPLRTLGS